MPHFDADRLDRAFALLGEACEQEEITGAVAAVGGADGIHVVRAYGFAATGPEQISMRASTVFDLADLTQVVATLPAVLQLVEQGRLLLDVPVARWLPELDQRITVRHLLTHTSGLPAWQPLYLEQQGEEAYLRAICRMPLASVPGTRVTFSDFGFLLLAEVVQLTSGLPLQEYCQERIFHPLGMYETGWAPRLPRHRIAATERGPGREYLRCGERAAAYTHWRQGLIWGEVNDGNTYYGLGGVSGHAGLFSTVTDLAVYARTWLSAGSSLLAGRTMLAAARNQTPGLEADRGLGWAKPPTRPLLAEPPCAGGELLSPSAIGHAGETGTSIWIDPEQDLFVILLTNQLGTDTGSLCFLRPAFHNAVAAGLR